MKFRRLGSLVLFASLLVAALAFSGALDVRFAWNQQEARALDFFGSDDSEEDEPEPFWNKGADQSAVEPRGVPGSFADLAEKVSPGVVNIRTSKTLRGDDVPRGLEEFFFGGPFGQSQRERTVPSLGSGFVISEDGYIVTNNHVVEDVDTIQVLFADDQEVEAKVIGRDPKTDLALLHIESNEKLFALPLGDSESVRPGEWVVAIGNPYDDGAGLRMGLAARGAGIHLADYHITLPFYPPASLTFGIFVNAQGQRFVAEDAYHGRIGELASRQPEGRVYLIVDEPSYGRPEIDGFELAATEESIADLERALDLPEFGLQQTVDYYNRHAERGQDPLLRKQSHWLRPIKDAPFAALECSLGKAPYMAFSLGGLWTKPSGEVLTPNGRVVPGLYAAGGSASGLAAQGYNSGLSLGDCTFSGRVAGAAVARSSR